MVNVNTDQDNQEADIEKKEVHSSMIASAYVFCVGAGIQVCWSSVINSLTYFEEYYPKGDVPQNFPIAVYLAQFIVTCLMTQISTRFQYSTRIVVPFICASLVLAFLPFEAQFLSDTPIGYPLILAMLFVMGFSSNICYTSMIGLTSRLPGKYTTYALLGSGGSGMVLSILKLLMKYIFPGRTGLGVIVFFLNSAVFIVIAIVLHFRFINSAFYQRFLLEEDAAAIQSTTDAEVPLTKAPIKVKRDKKTVMEVFSKIKIIPFAIGLTFTQMFSVFPGVMLMKNMEPIPKDVALPTMNFCFSIFFIVGKKLGQFRRYYNKTTILVIVLLRFFICAFFILQAISNDIPIISSNWFAYVNITFFGLTTGLCNCALFILGPEGIEPEKKEIAGFINVFGLATGTLIGVLVAWPLKYIAPAAHH